MTVWGSRLPFSLDALIAEAKRRMRRRRLLLVVIAALLVGGVVGGALAARSPGGPGNGNGGVGSGNRAQNNQPASFKGPTKPPVTAAMIAAAHRDEAKMLRLFVPPPGAQRLAHEPAFMRRRRMEIFGIGPTGRAKFARFANWRVRSSVASVLAFEQAHRPRGAAPINGWGMKNGPHVPPNRSLVIVFPRIHGLVSARIMRVFILRLPSGWTVIRAAATNRTWIPYRYRTRAPANLTRIRNNALRRVRKGLVGPPMLVLVAAREIPKGTPGTVIRNHPRFYRFISIPQSQARSGAILDPSFLVGRLAMKDIQPGARILPTDFAPRQEPLIAHSKRPVTLNAPRQINGPIIIGSHVEVLLKRPGHGLRSLFPSRVLFISRNGDRFSIEVTSRQYATLFRLSKNAGRHQLVLRQTAKHA
jgi:hypothetical protein